MSRRAVALMNVKVNNGRSGDSALFSGPKRCNCDVVENAETGAFTAKCVMSSSRQVPTESLGQRVGSRRQRASHAAQGALNQLVRPWKADPPLHRGRQRSRQELLNVLRIVNALDRCNLGRLRRDKRILTIAGQHALGATGICELGTCVREAAVFRDDRNNRGGAALSSLYFFGSPQSANTASSLESSATFHYLLVEGSELETVREISAGGVVLRKMRGIWHIAAIEPQTRNDEPVAELALPEADIAPKKRVKPPVIALPKGAVDPGEKPEQTAAREIMEETGVQARRIAKLTDIKYFYQRTWGGRERVFKVVSFFLFMYRSGRLGEIQPEMRVEVRRAMWLPLAESHRRLSYKGEREVAKLRSAIRPFSPTARESNT